MTKPPKHPPVDHRAPDQDGAVEVAFLEGTLPEEDRRKPAVVPAAVEPEPVVEAVAVDPTLAALTAAGVGSVFEKTAIGWNVKLVDGGTVIHVQGPSIADAIGSHGAQIVHPKSADQLAREAAR